MPCSVSAGEQTPGTGQGRVKKGTRTAVGEEPRVYQEDSEKDSLSGRRVMQSAIKHGRDDAEARIVSDAELDEDGASSPGGGGRDEGGLDLPALQDGLFGVVGGDGGEIEEGGRVEAGLRGERCGEEGEAAEEGGGAHCVLGLLLGLIRGRRRMAIGGVCALCEEAACLVGGQTAGGSREGFYSAARARSEILLELPIGRRDERLKALKRGCCMQTTSLRCAKYRFVSAGAG